MNYITNNLAYDIVGANIIDASLYDDFFKFIDVKEKTEYPISKVKSCYTMLSLLVTITCYISPI